MTKPSKKDTVRLSFNDKERAIVLLRTLARIRFFGETLPTEAELSRLLRIPKSSITLGLSKLEAEGVLERQGTAYISHAWRDQTAVGRVAFVLNTDILKSWYSLFQDWLMGFEHTMCEEGYETTLLTNFASKRDKIERLALARERGIMGVALASSTEPELLEFLSSTALPSVVLGNATIYQQQIGSVCSDNRAGTEKIINHLIEHGHRRISFYVNGLSFHDGYRERLGAYQAHLRGYGLTPDSDLVMSEPHHEALARRAAAILCNKPQKPTAVACATDREAFELVAALRHLGMEVPRDLSVAGFDNNHFTQVLEPPMTTVDIYAFEMGRVAANYLLNEMQAPQMPVKILLPADLVVRLSTAAIKAESDPLQAPLLPPPPQEIVTF
jgi:DNA-binding LacI/PurR family transcriptional regulator